MVVLDNVEHVLEMAYLGLVEAKPKVVWACGRAPLQAGPGSLRVTCLHSSFLGRPFVKGAIEYAHVWEPKGL